MSDDKTQPAPLPRCKHDRRIGGCSQCYRDQLEREKKPRYSGMEGGREAR